MKTLKITGTILAAALMLAVFSPAARADQATQQTRLTFSNPVQIPGNKVLPPGTYWFSIPDPIGAPNTVAIFDGNNKHLEGMVETRTIWRSFPAAQARADTQVTLAEQSADGTRPDALMSWFYPGMPNGHQFMYSHRMDTQLSEMPQVDVQVGTNHSTVVPPPRMPGSLGNS